LTDPDLLLGHVDGGQVEGCMRRLMVLVVMVPALGCGVSPQDTRAMWSSVQKTLGARGANTQALSVSVGLEMDCAKGGTADVTVNLNIDDDSPLFDLAALFGYEIEYEACQPDVNTLDGDLKYAASLVADRTDDGGVLTIRTLYRGTITVSGESNYTCDIDVTGSLDAAAYERPGDEFAASVHMEYSGTICDQDADEVLDVSVDSST
jgi:hypothetical protein